MKYLTLVAFTLAYSLTALAQDPPPAGDPAPADGKSSEKTTTRPQPAGESGDERFIPSESIKEDLSVSFPSDI